MALGEDDLELDAAEERRGRIEHNAIRAGVGIGEVADAAVVVGDPLACERAVRAQQLDAHARGGQAALRVEHVGGNGAHAAHSLSAWARCSRAISSSRALTRAPPRTTSRPPTSSLSTRCGPLRTRFATRSS